MARIRDKIHYPIKNNLLKAKLHHIKTITNNELFLIHNTNSTAVGKRDYYGYFADFQNVVLQYVSK